MTEPLPTSPQDSEFEDLMRRHYRWWKIFGWWNTTASRDKGLKLGPISFGSYEWDGRREWYLSIIGRHVIIDTGLRRHRAQS